jgi:alpha-L-rhamnosidase
MNKKSIFNSCIIVFLSLLSLIFTSCKEQPTLESASELTISEGFKNPLGFYDAKPTFSWKLPVSENIKTQFAYQIVAASNPDLLPDNPDLWDSKKQETEQSAWVKYKGKTLQSRQKVYWQVKYWNQNKEASNWSDINHFELGLLNNSDWQAKWVGLNTAKDSIKGRGKVLIDGSTQRTKRD